jgi:hypothetical protein
MLGHAQGQGSVRYYREHWEGVRQAPEGRPSAHWELMHSNRIWDGTQSNLDLGIHVGIYSQCSPM